jgi:hypothetical protein
MRIGIIAEGKSDLGVIDNVLKAATGLDTSNFFHILPSDELDETDLGLKTWSTWSLVRKECMEGSAIENFFQLEGNKCLVLHIDTDTAQEYEIIVPTRDVNYCERIRESVIKKIKEWLNNRFENKLLFAIAVEEIEAWFLNLYINPKKLTDAIPNPKKALEFALNKIAENTTSNYENYQRLSKPFAKEKEINKYLAFNCSLRLFFEEARTMHNNLLNE